MRREHTEGIDACIFWFICVVSPISGAHTQVRVPNPHIGKTHHSGIQRAKLVFMMDALLSVISEGQEITVKVGDLSRSGMRVLANSRIARGTSVRVEYQDLVAQGVVWHSRRFREGYSIGIEFLRISKIVNESISSKHPTQLRNAEKLREVSEPESARSLPKLHTTRV